MLELKKKNKRNLEKKNKTKDYNQKSENLRWQTFSPHMNTFSHFHNNNTKGYMFFKNKNSRRRQRRREYNKNHFFPSGLEEEPNGYVIPNQSTRILGGAMCFGCCPTGL